MRPGNRMLLATDIHQALGKLREEVCGFKPQSKSHVVLVIDFTLSSLAVFVVVPRLASRYLISRQIWLDCSSEL